MANQVNDDFVNYCKTLSDRQLENVLKKEYDAFEHRDYPSALSAAHQRGWTVINGVRV